MTTPVIIDAILVIILVVFVVWGTRRGLLRTLAGLVIVIVALVGAGMVAATVSAPAAELVQPLIEERISEKVQEAVALQGNLSETEQGQPAPEAFQLQALLERLGLDEDVWASLIDQIQERMADTGAAVADAVAGSLIYSLIYGILYLVSFLALLLLLNVLLKAMDLVTQLPVIHGLNALGGGILGLLEGVLLLFLAVWIARRMGVSFASETLAQAHILRIFITHTPLSVLSFLQ